MTNAALKVINHNAASPETGLRSERKGSSRRYHVSNRLKAAMKTGQPFFYSMLTHLVQKKRYGRRH